MRFSDLLVAGVSLALSTDALTLEKRDDPAVLKLDLQKKDPGVLANSARKRQTVEAPDVNYQNQLLYIVELLIGTPPQSTFVQLDTGSSDLVVETPLSDICSAAPPNPCTNFGAYTANSSSTYQYIDSNFEVAYGGGDGATGDWCSDTVSIGGATLQGAQFGIQYQSTILEGIVGVSYPIIEARNTFSGEPVYPNLPMLLVQQGYIASRAFSLWTNDDRSASGTLLFGGIDTSKFSGQLVTIDLLASGFDNFPGVVDFTISLNGVSGTDAGGNTVTLAGAIPINVIMDSGTTFTILSADIAASIWAFAGATVNANDPNSASIPCSAASSTLTVNLEFNGITIPVPLSQLVVFPDSTGETCSFGIMAASSGYIVGDTVLTAMYVVYDLDNNQLSLAPTVFNSTAPENILQITAGPSGVPDTFHSSSSVAASSSTSSSAPSSTSSSSSPSSTSSSSSSSTLSSTSSTSSSSSPSSTSSSSSSSSSTLSSTSSSSSSSSTASSTSSSSSSSSSSTVSSTSSSSSSSSSSTLSSTSSSTSSSSSSITSSTLPTSTTKSTTSTTTAKLLKCNKDNCFLAIQHASATAFCAAYQAGIPTPTPTAIAKGCQTLSSRISSGCACLGPATVSTSSVHLTSTSSSTKVISSTSSRSSTYVIPTSPPLKCSMNNCLRAVEGASATYFCSAYVTGAPVPVPTKIANECSGLASKVTSACNCLISSA